MKKDLLEKLIRDCVKAELNEGLRSFPSITLCGGKQVPFGCPEHIADLQRTLDGLEVVKTHWDRGSSNRYVVSSACARIKKLIQKLNSMNSSLSDKEDMNL